MVQGLSFTFFFLFGGIFIRAPDIPAGWRWFYFINPVPKGVIALATPQFECTGINCPQILVLNQDGTSTLQYTRDYVSFMLDTGYGMYWNYIGWLLLTIFIFRLLAAWALQKVNHMKR
jgi:hypothetical protein